MKLNDAMLRPEANNFVAVRLLLATSVIYTHTYWIKMGRPAEDDLSWLLGAPVSVYAVDGFFFLSGFLVYPSLLRFGKSFPFLVARLARLWPALAVATAVTVIGGGLFSEAVGLDYFVGDTARFVLLNTTFLRGSFYLTGVNCGAEPCVVNGSLWTLPWEARCYLLLGGLGALGLARPITMKWVVLPATFVGAILWDFPQVQKLATEVLGEGAAYYLNTFDRLWTLFALGIAAFIFRSRLELNWWVLLLLFALTLISAQVGASVHIRGIFVGYLVLCFGILTARSGAFSGNWPDYSYGMYIYAFPLMMVLHGMAFTQSHWILGVVNALVTLPAAALSWHFVEKPVMDAMKNARARRPAKAVVA